MTTDPGTRPSPEPNAAPAPAPAADGNADLGEDDDLVEDDTLDDDDGALRPQSGRQNRIALIGTVALVVALAFGGGFATGRATAPAATGDGAGPVPAPTAVASASAVLPSEGERLGRADAKVAVDYWADFQCPFCARFAQTVLPALGSRIADGTIAVVHRDFAFIGDESVDAAVAVRCAAREGKYWTMHDAVYAAQAGENEGGFARARLGQIAASVGLDAAAFTSCLDDHSFLVDVLDDTAAGVRAGIASTPTIDVNGTRFLGVPDTAKLLAAIDAVAAGATPAPAPTAEPSPNQWTGTATSGREAGDSAAPVTVELWMDYQSTDSANVAKKLEPQLRTRIAAGKVRVVLRDLALLGDESVVASTMIRCVAKQDGTTWFVHDVLASSAGGAATGIFTVDNLERRLAARLGLEVRVLDSCLGDPTVAADVKAETGQAALGLKAGPAVVVKAGGRETARFSGALDVPKVLAAVDAAR